MHSWGIGAFENNDALDWLYELEKSDGLESVLDVLEEITKSNKAFINDPECFRGIAAAEVLSAFHGEPCLTLPKDVRQWLDKQEKHKIDKELREKAVLVIQKVKNHSDAQTHWEESDEFDVWKDELDSLIKRLK